MSIGRTDRLFQMPTIFHAILEIHKNVGEDRDIIAYCYSEERKE